MLPRLLIERTPILAFDSRGMVDRAIAFRQESWV